MARIQDGNSNPILDDVISSGSLGALNDAVMLALHGQGIAAFQFRSPTAPVFEVSFEGSVDGVDWQLLTAIKGEDGSTFGVDTVPTAGIFFVACGGLDWVRVRVSTYTSGSITVAAKAGYGAGTVSLTPYAGAVTLSGAVDQGAPAASAQAWPVKVSDGVDDAEVMASAPAGTEKALVVRNIPSGTQAVSGTVAVTPPVPVTDNGGSLTVDSPQLPAALAAGGGIKVEGVVGGVAQPISAASLPLPTGAATSALQTQPGVDIGDVTVNNAAGAGAVNVQDGGNSLTVDGSVSITGTPTVDTELPAAAALADAAANPTTPTVGAAGLVYNGATWDRRRGNTSGAFAQGPVAHDAAIGGNPNPLGARANTNEPATPVADGDVTHLWADLLGRLVVIEGHPNPEPPVTVNATANGATTVIAAPGASVRIHVKRASVHNRAATNRQVSLRDGAAGTTRWSAELAANGGGSLIDFGSHGWALTANTLLAVFLDAAGDVDVNITDYYLAP